MHASARSKRWEGLKKSILKKYENNIGKKQARFVILYTKIEKNYAG
jgi:hypothetical protein